MATLMSCVLKCVAIFLQELQVCNFLSQIHPNPLQVRTSTDSKATGASSVER